jgi:drug/metabolite transporter (DMT)-like permease
MPDAGPFGPGSSVIVLGLISAITFGAADFGGGWTSRRAPLLGVVLGTQIVGMVIAAAIFAARAEPLPSPADLAWSVVAGIAGLVGVTALYRGLAVGRMGVVAPVTGVIGASIPVVVGVLTEGRPSGYVAAGIGLALVAVVLVSRVPGEHGQRSGIELAVGAGLAIGVFNTSLGQISDGAAFGPLAVIRLIDVAIVGVAIVAIRRPWRVARNALPAVLLVGVLDMAGNASYLLATQVGELAIAAILSSLYPVSTVVLAALLLRERVTGSHAVGIVTAVAAVVLIGVGRTG